MSICLSAEEWDDLKLIAQLHEKTVSEMMRRFLAVQLRVSALVLKEYREYNKGKPSPIAMPSEQ
jgi:hypothetical protein